MVSMKLYRLNMTRHTPIQKGSPDWGSLSILLVPLFFLMLSLILTGSLATVYLFLTLVSCLIVSLLSLYLGTNVRRIRVWTGVYLNTVWVASRMWFEQNIGKKE